MIWARIRYRLRLVTWIAPLLMVLATMVGERVTGVSSWLLLTFAFVGYFLRGIDEGAGWRS